MSNACSYSSPSSNFFRAPNLGLPPPPNPIRDPQSRFAQSARVPGPADKWHQNNGVSQFLVLKRAVDPC